MAAALNPPPTVAFRERSACPPTLGVSPGFTKGFASLSPGPGYTLESSKPEPFGGEGIAINHSEWTGLAVQLGIVVGESSFWEDKEHGIV